MTSDLSWLMTSFRDETAGVLHVLLLSRDGLQLARDDSLGVDDADQLAAISCGVASLAQGASEHFDGGGEMRTVSIDLPTRQLLIMGAGDGSLLAVLADAESDPGMVAMRMVHVIERVASHLGVEPRATEARTP